MKPFPLSLITLAVAVGLGGCSTLGGSKFACPTPHGVTCMDATDVYKATNNADHVTGVDPREARKLFEEGQPAGIVPQPAAPVPSAPAAPVIQPAAPVQANAEYASAKVDFRPIGDTLAVASPAVAVLGSQGQAVSAAVAPAPTRAAGPEPVAAFRADGGVDAYREPARIMRIYVAPWQDASGDLHMSGYMYAEVAPRRWAVPTPGAGVDDGLLRLVAPPQAPTVAEGPTRRAARAPTSSNAPSQWKPGPPAVRSSAATNKD